MTTRSHYTMVRRGVLTLRRFARERDAAAVVEFAIVVALLLMIVLGTLSWSKYFLVRASVTNAVREGARYGSVRTKADSVDIRTYTTARISDTITRNLSTVEVTFPADSNVRVKVTVSSFNPFTLFVMKSARTIIDSAQFRLESP